MSPRSQPMLPSNGARDCSPPPSKILSEDIRISDPIPFARSSQDAVDVLPLHNSELVSASAVLSTNKPTTAMPGLDNSRHSTRINPLNAATSHAPQSSISTAMTKDSITRRRRGSTLKSVMRKIFGRKRRSDPESLRREAHNISLPPQWTPTLETVGHPVKMVSGSLRSRSNRAPSLPTNPGSLVQTPPQSPLKSAGGSHSRRSGNRSPKLDYRRPRRRATLPSIVLSAHEARDLAIQIAQQNSRRNSIHSPTRGVELPDAFEQKTSRQQKRRSRSASELRDMARAHRMSPIQWRRRSDEIKFWRESFLKMDASPSMSARPETRSTIASVLEDTDHAEVEQSLDDPFHFTALMGTMQDNSDTGLAQRVNMLEVKLMDLEFAIAKLQGHDFCPVKQTFEAGMRRNPPYNSNQQATVTKALPSNFVSSFTPPRSSPTPDRPDSTATLRPYTASHNASCQTPSSFASDFKGISVEQYSALTTLVRREQTARKLLEQQIFQLQRDVSQLQSYQRPTGQQSFLLPSYSDSSDRLSSRRGSDRKTNHDPPETDSDDGFMAAHHRKIEDAYRRANMETPERNRVVGMI
ncbi:hypothetical protein BDDG_05492 [Blastomyces dermatitidis ATCC 18188]|uniref:Uncharacterized protein n=1 Tax=Ajellomyces dermatitidis (strain ATCC 18188 / CBS 674.68) TaxID=653446 RepID=F2TH35_AJEDA|nr:hypothetical protein BDDG_05492 [Blastomyces dermatitidis ATCC 18188]